VAQGDPDKTCPAPSHAAFLLFRVHSNQTQQDVGTHHCLPACLLGYLITDAKQQGGFMKRPTFLQATGALRCLTLACVMAASSLGWQGASAQSAQSYPSRPMRMIIPFSPGGAADILGCSLSEPLGKRLGQPVLIINRDGAGTVIGVNEAAHASRDGYTLLFSGDAAIINMASGRKLPYDLFKDLAPVSIAYSGAQAMVVRRSGPFNTLQDLVKYGREKPGQVKFGSVGVGSAAHMSAELFNQAAGIKGLHVPYRGAAPALTDLAGGHFDFIIIGTSAVMAAVKGGQFRALAIMSKERSQQMPDLPTSLEQGVNAETGSWYGLFMTGGSPASAVNKVHAALTATVKSPEIVSRYRSLGGEARIMTPLQFTAYMKREVQKFSKLIRELNIKLEE